MPAAHPVRPVQVPDGSVLLDGDLSVPPAARGFVVFAHGSGSSRFSARNQQVAAALNDAGFATLLLDLLTSREESADRYTAAYRFDIPRLGRRVVAAFDWAAADGELRALPTGCFGASTGAAAALIAAAARPRIAAVVSRGGRPDLAGPALAQVKAPTLLIVGGHDEPVIEMNEEARRQMTADIRLEIVPNATHLFAEPGALERVAELAIDWFRRHFAERPAASGLGRTSGSGPTARREVPPHEWPEMLDSFAREHRAWLAHVERDGRPGPHPDRPLRDVRAEQEGPRVVAIRITFDNAPREAAEMRIEDPVALAVETSAGTSTALEVQDAHGHHTAVRFRVAAPAAMLDGVAPGEL